MQLFQSFVGRKRLGLNFVLFRSCLETDRHEYRRVDCRTEVGVILDDVTALRINFDTFASFVNLKLDFDALTLDFCERTLLILRLLQPDFFLCARHASPPGHTLARKGQTGAVQSLVLHSLDLAFTIFSQAMLLLLHKTSAQQEASLIRIGQQGVIKSLTLSHID